MSAPVLRMLEEAPQLAELAAKLLRSPQDPLPLSADEAHLVARRMHLLGYGKGAVLLRAGDRSPPTHMLLVLAGDVSVESGQPGDPDTVPISVLGPGSLLGEMAVLDGAPRSASCVATSAVQAAGLTRDALLQLVQEEPRVAAKLLAAVAQRIAERLRAFNDQLQIYAHLNAAQRAEIERMKASSGA